MARISVLSIIQTTLKLFILDACHEKVYCSRDYGCLLQISNFEMNVEIQFTAPKALKLTAPSP